MPAPQTLTATLPCKDEQAAVAFAEYINTNFDPCAKADGRTVNVETATDGAEPFLAAIAHHATIQYWALGAEMALAVYDIIDGLRARTAA